MSANMTLSEFLDGMRAAFTADELEAAIHAPFKHPFYGPTWARICKVRKEAGRAICDSHPLGRFVPRFGPRRVLSVCGESYKVGHGQNSTGVRYVWHYAEEFAIAVLRENSLSRRCAAAVWDCWNDYPHRCLQIVEDGLDGKMEDPPFNKLLFGRLSSGPVRVGKGEAKHRAHRPCGCGGTRWDWGCGWNGWANFINWHCDGCRRVYTEYVTSERLTQIRSNGEASHG